MQLKVTFQLKDQIILQYKMEKTGCLLKVFLLKD